MASIVKSEGHLDSIIQAHYWRLDKNDSSISTYKDMPEKNICQKSAYK